MKTSILTIAFAAAAAMAVPASAQSIVVVTAPSDKDNVLPVAFAELQAGQNMAAVEKLTSQSDLDARDPSRLINLGTAYARTGRLNEAKAAYSAAATSPIRYDLELASGAYMDSRWAAREALASLDGRSSGYLALAQ